MEKFSCTHKAQYYETDQMGIVHHSNYIRWFEEARTELLRHIGYPYKRMEEEGIICPVLSVECQYRSMVHFEDVVLIEPVVEKFNGIKLFLKYEIYDSETGELRTTGKSVHCFLNEQGQPVSLKKTKPDLYDTLIQAMEAGKSEA
ncbi:MAG: acyl-CoA thioesterase [Lachnospiraceae bacterium]|nr:acyl-CoA thioesterase [Lachnospiraceae bacterium]MDD3615381.1 acyl-CoA thioesterase [Lachnospiraceae bacterium]